MQEKNNRDKQQKKSGKALPEYGRKPNRLIYFTAAHLLRPLVKLLFHVEYHVDPQIRKIQPPLIVMGNHPSYLDPFLLAAALYPLKINFLASSSFFRNKKLFPLLNAIGVIPKTQFRADPGAVKAMLKVARRGGVIGIYPEGARSIDGTSHPVEDSISKFIKKIEAPVVIALEKGAYLTWPRWSQSRFRRGKIRLEVRLLHTREEVASLTPEELQDHIRKALQYDEYEWQRQHRFTYRSKAPALGLHNVLHQCPACKKRWVTASSTHTLYCKSCGNTAVMDEQGFLHPQDSGSVVFETPAEWNQWQISDLTPCLLSEDFVLSDEADLFISEREAPYLLAGNGTVSLNRRGFLYQGSMQGEVTEKFFPLSGILGISSDYGQNFDLVSDRFTYHFVLKNGQKSISFTHALSLLRNNPVI